MRAALPELLGGWWLLSRTTRGQSNNVILNASQIQRGKKRRERASMLEMPYNNGVALCEGPLGHVRDRNPQHESTNAQIVTAVSRP
jgi:hypothetical protein